MNESIIEDLLPFIFMIVPVIVMAVIGAIYMLRRRDDYQYGVKDENVERGQDASVGYGSTFQG
jgi:hypothetical protein